MANLLRAHPAVAMGRERYAWRFREGSAFNPTLFEKDRFCLQHDPADSHHAKHQPYYANLHARFDRCVYVGDKLPSLYLRYDYVLETFPGCRIIYMARNVVDVAASFQGRVEKSARQRTLQPDADPTRLWPAERDWRSAIVEWNEAVEATLALRGSPQLLVVDYERLFSDDGLLDELCAFLELPVARALRTRWNAGKQRRREIEAGRKPRLTPLEVEEVRRLAYVEKLEWLKSRNAP
jgi:hypothetical protein